MIKNCCYIKRFTPAQKAQLEQVAREQKLKNANDVFFFVLKQYLELKPQVERQKRFLERKTAKIDELNKQLNRR